MTKSLKTTNDRLHNISDGASCKYEKKEKQEKNEEMGLSVLVAMGSNLVVI